MYVRENAGKGREPDSPLAPALCPSSALSSWLSFSPNVLQKGPTSKPTPSLRFPDSLPSPKSQPAPPHLGGAVTQESVRVCRVCAGARGGQAPRACGHRNSPEAETLYRASASLSPETQTHHQANFGVLLWGSFWLFPSIWGTG